MYLLLHQCFDFLGGADYWEGRVLDRLVKRILDRMAVVNDLVESHLGQLRDISRP